MNDSKATASASPKRRDTEFYYRQILDSVGMDIKDDHALRQVAFAMLKTCLLRPDENQPRQHFDDEAIYDLAASIRVVGGLIQPIVVRPIKNGRYRIISGERRWRAARLIEMDEVPCIIRERLDSENRIISLIENIQREDLNAIEIAEAMKSLIDGGISHEDLSRHLGMSRPAVSNHLRLLDLAPEVRRAVVDERITMGHARPLIVLDHSLQRTILDRIERFDWSVRKVESVVRHYRKGRVGGRQSLQHKLVERSNQVFQSSLGSKIELRMLPAGKVSLVLKSIEDLERLLSLLGGQVADILPAQKDGDSNPS